MRTGPILYDRRSVRRSAPSPVWAQEVRGRKILRRRWFRRTAAGATAGILALTFARETEDRAAGLAFEIDQDSSNPHRWRLGAANDPVIATSAEGYVALADCWYGIELVPKEAAGARVEEVAR